MVALRERRGGAVLVRLHQALGNDLGVELYSRREHTRLECNGEAREAHEALDSAHCRALQDEGGGSTAAEVRVVDGVEGLRA